jgi:hypothetical protein
MATLSGRHCETIAQNDKTLSHFHLPVIPHEHSRVRDRTGHALVNGTNASHGGAASGGGIPLDAAAMQDRGLHKTHLPASRIIVTTLRQPEVLQLAPVVLAEGPAT